MKIAGYTANFNTASCDQNQYRDYGTYVYTYHSNGVSRPGKYTNVYYGAYGDYHRLYSFDTGWIENTNNYAPQAWTNQVVGFATGVHHRELRVDKKYFNDL